MPMSKDEIRSEVERLLQSPECNVPLYGTGKQQARNSRGDAAFESMVEMATADIEAAGDSAEGSDAAAR
jgi:hypothetical protein